MATFDVDSLFDPIQIILGGITYTIEKITQEMMDKTTALGSPDENAPKNNLNLLYKQLSIFLGASEEELKQHDVRKLTRVLKWLMDQINKEFRGEDDAKNVEAEVSNTER